VIQIGGEHFRIGALGALKLLSRGYLYGWIVCDVGHQEVHGNVLAVHVLIHPILNVSRHGMCVHVAPVLVMEGSSGKNHGYLVRPLRFVVPAHGDIVPDMNATGKADYVIGELTPDLVALKR